MLEPRILLDAAAFVTAAETTQDQKDNQPQPVAQPTETPQETGSANEFVAAPYATSDETPTAAELVTNLESTALVVIDTGVAGYEDLLADLDPDTEVLLIDSHVNGLQQLADYVEGRDDITSIHILSHGDQGEITLGNAVINNDTLPQYEALFAQIGESLTEDGDLLLYGCNVAEDGIGVDFVTRVAEVTDADVAASTDLTGAAELDGDWDLEYTIGQIDGADLELTSFKGLLFNPVTLNFTGPVFDTGSATTEGDLNSEWRFNDVATNIDVGDATTDIYAIVTLTNLENKSGGVLPTLADIDGDTTAGAWDPVLGEPAGGAANENYSATLRVEFFREDTDAPVSIDTYFSPRDVDGGFTGNPNAEYVAVTAPIVSVVVAGGASSPPNGYEDGGGQTSPYDGTALTDSLTYTNGQTTITLVTNPTVINQGIDDDEAWAATFQVVQGSTFDVEIGVDATLNGGGNPLGTRLFSFLFDEVTFTSPNTLSIPIIDADDDDSSGATGWDYDVELPYVSGDGDIAIVDADVSITDTDPNAVNMVSATINLTNPLPGDVLNANTAAINALGITVTGEGSSTINLSGVASMLAYEQALLLLTFANNNSILDGSVDREIEITINNGYADSPVATTTIDVFGTPTVDTLNTINTQPTIMGTYDDTTDQNGDGLSVTVNGLTYTTSDTELMASGGTWTLNLTGTQTLSPGTYDVSVVSSDGTTNKSDQTTNEVRILGAPEWSITGDTNVVDGNTAGYTIDLLGAEALTSGQTVSVLLELTDITTDSADYGDFDTLIANAVIGTNFTYSPSTSLLTYTAPASPEPSVSLTFNLQTTDNGDVVDESLKIDLSGANSSTVSTSDFEVTTVITDVDDAPVITGTDTTDTFTENVTAPIDLFNVTNVTAVEAGQTIEEVVLTVTGLLDGDKEVLTFDGVPVSLNDGSSVTPSGYSYTVSEAGGTATITIDTSGTSPAAIQTLLDGITYRNNVPENPTAGNRVITVTSITDSGTTGGGNQNSAAGGLSSTINVVPVDDAPVVTAPLASIIADSTGTNVAIHGAGFTIDDVDVDAATDTIDVELRVGTAANPAAGTGGSITVTLPAGSGIALSNNGTSVVTLTGTLSEIDSLLRNDDLGTIFYSTTNIGTNDYFEVFVDDNGNTPGPAATGSNEVLISRPGSNNPPILSNIQGDLLAYTEGDGVQAIDQGAAATVSDADGDYTGGRLVIGVANNEPGEDRFSIQEIGGITVQPNGDVIYGGLVIGNSFNFNDLTGGFITLTSNATDAAVQALVRAISYENVASLDPTTGTRTITYTLEDGDGGADTETATITVAIVDGPPVLDLDDDNSSGATGTSYQDTFGGTAVNIVDSDTIVTEPEGTPLDVLITVATVETGDELIFGGTVVDLSSNSTQNNITVGGVVVDVSYNSTSQVVTITDGGGNPLTPAETAAVLKDIQFNNSSPSNFTDRGFAITVDDGTTPVVATSTISINAPPSVGVDGGVGTSYSGTFVEDGGAVSLTGTATITDPDSDPVSILITPQNSPDGANEVLVIGGQEFALDGNGQAIGDIDLGGGVIVDVVYDGTTLTILDDDGVSLLNPADAKTVLESITYRNDAGDPDPANRVFDIQVSDGFNTSTAVTSTLGVTPVNDAPTINNLDNEDLAYFIGSGAVAIDSGGVSNVFDDEDNFNTGSLTVTITSGGVPADDTLSIQDAGNIVVVGSNIEYSGTVIGSFTGGTGGTPLVFTFNANADSTNISELLQNITFEYAGTNGGDRTVTFVAEDDGSLSRNIASLDITIGSDIVATPDTYNIDSDGVLY